MENGTQTRECGGDSRGGAIFESNGSACERSKEGCLFGYERYFAGKKCLWRLYLKDLCVCSIFISVHDGAIQYRTCAKPSRKI